MWNIHENGLYVAHVSRVFPRAFHIFLYDAALGAVDVMAATLVINRHKLGYKPYTSQHPWFHIHL